VIKIVPEEVYAISHHVHHYRSEKPGDPYNVNGGWLYCFLADANHQAIARNLSEKDYRRVCGMIEHTGIRLNSYSQYLKWGSIAHPFTTLIHYILNWGFWYGTFFLIGGHALAVALFGMSGVWAIGIRTYNFEGHGKGKDQRQDGIDFNRDDLSVNQLWPGFVAGEWHNNHHLYPNGARSGFLPYQLDLAWLFIQFYSKIGGIKCYRDYKADFMRDHYLPYLAKKSGKMTLQTSRSKLESRTKLVEAPKVTV
jgi:stearoyl-CoA desaturase (delta-9 desaturase)